jgi:hypothetical protein
MHPKVKEASLKTFLLASLLGIAGSGQAATVASMGYPTNSAGQTKPGKFYSDMAQGRKIDQFTHGCRWAVRTEIFAFDDAVVYTDASSNNYNVFPINVVLAKGCSIYDKGMEPFAIGPAYLDNQVQMSGQTYRAPSLATLGYAVDGGNHARPQNFTQIMQQGVQLTQRQHGCTWASRPYIYAFADGVVYANAERNDYNIFSLKTVSSQGCKLPTIIEESTMDNCAGNDSMGSSSCDSDVMPPDSGTDPSNPDMTAAEFSPTVGPIPIPASENYVSVASNSFSYCGIRSDGTLRCAIGANQDYLLPLMAVPPTVKKAKKVVMDQMVTCALTGDNRVACWGPDMGLARVPPDLAQANSAVDIAANGLGACAVKTDKSLKCFGKNVPTVPADLGPVASIFAQGKDFCAIKASDSTLRCWGNSVLSTSLPPDLGPVKKIIWDGLGTSFACVIRQDNSTHCWDPVFPSTENDITTVPKELGATVDLSYQYQSMFNGSIVQVCGVNTAGKALCWGSSPSGAIRKVLANSNAKQVIIENDKRCVLFNNGELSCRDLNNSKTTGASTLKAHILTAGPSNMCSIDNQGQVRCWGKNEDMERPMLSIDAATSFETASSQNIALGGGHSCFLTDGYIICSGANEVGQGRAPAAIDDGDNLRVVAGDKHSCVLRRDNSIYCWGSNKFNQAKVPADLPPSKGLIAGANHSCAISTTGAVRCWGDNSDNQLAVPFLGQVNQLNAGRNHTCALTQDGSMTCWGRNAESQTAVPADLGAVTDIAAGGTHSCAVKQDGKLRCWGDNKYGQLTVPAYIDAVKQVEVGDGFTCATRRSDDNLYCWGRDDEGQTRVPTRLDYKMNKKTNAMVESAVGESFTMLCGTINSARGACNFVPTGLYSFAGLSARDDYTLKVTYSNSCAVDGGLLHLIIDNAVTTDSIYKPLIGADNGVIEFKDLKGPVNLFGGSTSNGQTVPTRSGFLLKNPTGCMFYLKSVTIIPSVATLDRWKDRAETLTTSLKLAFDKWLTIRNANEFRSQSVDKLKQNLEADRNSIVDFVANVLASTFPPDELVLSEVVPEEVLARITNEDEMFLKNNQGGMSPTMVREFKPYAQWPEKWRQLLEANSDPALLRTYSDIVQERVTRNSSLLAYLKTQEEPIGDLSKDEQTLKTVISDAKDFLAVTNFLKDGLKAELAAQIKELFENATSNSKAVCPKSTVDANGFAQCN